MIRTTYNPWLHRYTILVALATFLLVIAGALVTSNDAGLSVPDWPTSFGSFRMPRMVGGIMYEHGHRMIAGTVAILTVILALWLWRSDCRRWVRRLGAFAVLAVVAQAVLGGITVLHFLPPPISVAHACLAQLFFCTIVSLAVFTQADWRWDETKIEDPSHPPLRRVAVATTVAIFIQLMLGAAFRHHGFGVMPHVVFALLVAAMVLWVLVRAFGDFREVPQLKRPALLLTGLLLVQLFLGGGAYIEVLQAQHEPQPLPPMVTVTTAHVAVGALLLATSLVLTYRVYRLVGAPGRAIGEQEADFSAA
jgi:heme a synthase